jgi:Fe-S-cluster containining protein
MVLAHDQGACRVLRPDGRCGAYAARPLDCRLYPFVLERNDASHVTRLTLFDPQGCGEQGAAASSVADLERDDAERWVALCDYTELVARWNRLARQRSRLRHRARDAQAFFAFLGI